MSRKTILPRSGVSWARGFDSLLSGSAFICAAFLLTAGFAYAGDFSAERVYANCMDAQESAEDVTITLSTRVERTCYSPRQEIDTLLEVHMNEPALRLRMEPDDVLLGRLSALAGGSRRSEAGIAASELVIQDNMVMAGINDAVPDIVHDDSFCSMCVPVLWKAVSLIKNGGLSRLPGRSLMGSDPNDFISGCMKNRKISMPLFGAVFGLFTIGFNERQISSVDETMRDGTPVFEMSVVPDKDSLAGIFESSFDLFDVRSPRGEIRYYISKYTYRIIAFVYEISANGMPFGLDKDPCSIVVKGEARFRYSDRPFYSFQSF